MKLDSFLKIQEFGMSKETQIGKEKGLNQLKLALWENDKGKSDAQEEASLRLQGRWRMKEWSAIKRNPGQGDG